MNQKPETRNQKRPFLVSRLSFLVLFFLGTAEATQFTVSPTGSAGGPQPWSLSYVLSGGGGAIQPGDTIWLTTGNYGTGGMFRFTSSISGTSGSPIIVRQNIGDKAVIDGGIDHSGSYVWFWGFEITNTSNLGRGSAGIRPAGLVLNGHGNKAINLTVHDTGDPGISFLNQETSGEVYGCLLYANGYTDALGNVLGAGVDGHNDSGSVLLQDNMSFWNFANGMRAYGQLEPVVGFSFQNNASFNNGTEDIFAATASTGNPVQGLAIQNNSTFRNKIFAGGTGTETSGIRAGYLVGNQDAVIQNNTIVGTMGLSTGVLTAIDFKTLNVTNNVVVSSGQLVEAWISTQPAQVTTWDDNSYYNPSQVVGSTFPVVAMSSNAFTLLYASYTNIYTTDNSVTPPTVTTTTVFVGPVISTYTFDDWESTTSFDTFSNFSPVTPALLNAIVRPNKYEPGSRAQVVLYNWSGQGRPTIDFVGANLVDGARYEMIDAQNINGDPLLIFNPANVNFARSYFIYRNSQSAWAPALNAMSTSAPINAIQGAPPNFALQHTPINFGTFIILKASDPVLAPLMDAQPAGVSVVGGAVIGSSSSVPVPIWVENIGATGTLLHWSVSSDVGWATLAQSSGTLVAGQIQQINVFFDTTNLPLSYQHAHITFQDMDPSPVVSSQTLDLAVNIVPVPPPPPPPVTFAVPVIQVDPIVTGLSSAKVVYGSTQPVLEYFWTITPLSSLPTADSPNPAPAATGYTTSFTISDSNQLAFAPLALAPGYYQLQVRVAESTRISDPGVAYITIVGSDLSSIHLYPNPWRSDRDVAYPYITFDTLPADTTIKIFTVSGHIVQTLNGSGIIKWLLDNTSGERVASGLYIYLITDGQGNKAHGKLAIIR